MAVTKIHMQGRSFPLGATVYPEGVNFSVFSKSGESVQLLLFDHVNEINWFDWNLIAKNKDINRFAKQLIALRQSRKLPIERHDMTLSELLRRQPVQWHGVRLHSPDWGHESHVLSATIAAHGNSALLHVIVNAYWERLTFEIYPGGDGHEPWRRCIDTFLDSPEDICDWSKAPVIDGSIYTAQPRSVVVLITIPRNSGTI